MKVIQIEETVLQYELRQTRFNKLKLWVKVKCNPWDTNSGRDLLPYEIWRKANKNEVLEYLRRKK